MFNFLWWDLHSLKVGQVVEVDIATVANVKLLSYNNFTLYKNGGIHRFIGGFAQSAPCRIEVPCDGDWILVVDLTEPYTAFLGEMKVNSVKIITPNGTADEVITDLPEEATANHQTVFLEGRTDEKYFNKAAEVYGFHDLPFRFKWIGYLGDNGQESNTGKDALDKAVQFLISANLATKYIFLYDCDVKKTETEKSNTYIRVIDEYQNSKRMKKGVENALILDNIDLSPFYSTTKKEGDYGNDNTITTFDKMACCDAICSMDSSILESVFVNIKKEIEKLLNIFAEK